MQEYEFVWKLLSSTGASGAAIAAFVLLYKNLTKQIQNHNSMRHKSQEEFWENFKDISQQTTDRVDKLIERNDLLIGKIDALIGLYRRRYDDDRS